MEASSLSSSPRILPFSRPNNVCCSRRSESRSKSAVGLICRNNPLGRQTARARTAAVTDVSAVADPAQAEVTWQIVVGAIAGVTPFVVAGIEFSKRIAAQKRCGVCGGSGLVLRDKYYFRCPGCGGFLPWQSWKRFFSG